MENIQKQQERRKSNTARASNWRRKKSSHAYSLETTLVDNRMLGAHTE